MAAVISLAGSQTSRSEPGYLAGAVEAAERAAMEIIRRLKRDGEQVAAASAGPASETTP